MAIDLNTLSAKELDALIAQAKQRKTTLKKRKPIAGIRKRITDFAASEGYTIEELFGGKAGSRAKAAGATRPAARKGRKLGKVAPKYRNPAKPSETWTGRGKHPRWMAEQLKKGKKPEDFLIRKK
jgi:DNA-binding protein H-NS